MLVLSAATLTFLALTALRIRCPLTTSHKAVNEHFEDKVQQRRAHPSYNQNGDVENFRETTATLQRETTQKTLITNKMVLAVAFFSHAWTAKHQAEMFDDFVRDMPKNSVCVLLDFSMNYAHNHKDAAQQELWSAHQSTLLPVIVYMKDRCGRVTWARSHVFLSADLGHSNAFVQHVMDFIVKEYLEKFEKEGRGPLRHVHIWSDGCGGQFKNKNQMFWVSQGVSAAPGTKGWHSVRITHHFFQSCHGKGPSDSEGAVCKSGMYNAEMKHGEYLADTEAAFHWLMKYRAIPEPPEEGAAAEAAEARKDLHTISFRTFHLVAADAVDHNGLDDVDAVSHIMRNFCFDGAPGSKATLTMSESSHACPGCFEPKNLVWDGDTGPFLRDDANGGESGCTAGLGAGCDNIEIGVCEDVTMRRSDAARNRKDLVAATRARLERATKLLGDGPVHVARGHAWVLVYVSSVGGARDANLGSDVVPVRMVDGIVKMGGGRRAHLMVHWPDVVKKAADTAAETKELNFLYTDTSDAPQPIPLEKILTAPFIMGTEGRGRRPQRAAAAAAAAPDPRLVLPPGALQAAKSVISHDARAFVPDARL